MILKKKKSLLYSNIYHFNLRMKGPSLIHQLVQITLFGVKHLIYSPTIIMIIIIMIAIRINHIWK